MDNAASEEINQQAWENIFTSSVPNPDLLAHCKTLLALDPDQGILGIEQKIFELFRYYTYLWQNEQIGSDVFSDHPAPCSGRDEPFANIQELISYVSQDLRSIAQETSKPEILRHAIDSHDLESLQKERFITKDTYAGYLL